MYLSSFLRSSFLLSVVEGFEKVRSVLAMVLFFCVALLPALLYLACNGCSDLDLYRPQESNSDQDSRASLLNTQKNKKMKKPWKALRITKRAWKAVEALESLSPVTVSAPKSHVRPKRNMTPVVLMSSLMTVFRLFVCSLVRPSLFRMCLMRIPITKTKMTALKIRIAKMGPRKAPKNTAGSLMKQLYRGKSSNTSSS